jgi:cation transport ATPase
LVFQDITDKIASKFVATILALSLATFFVWLLILSAGVVKLVDSTFPYPVAASLFAVSLMVIFPLFYRSECLCAIQSSVSFFARLLHAPVLLVLLHRQPSQLQQV